MGAAVQKLLGSILIMATHSESRSFRKVCDKFNLRYKLNEAGEPISPTRKRVSPEDHLYDLHTGAIGVHISRETKKKYTFMKNKLIRLGCELIQDGDLEGNFTVAQNSLLQVAQELSCVKKNRTFTTEQRAAIRERLIG